MTKHIYLVHIGVSALLFAIVIFLAILTSQAYGNSAMDDAMRINGIQNQSSELTNEQLLAMIAASSLQTLPANSGMDLLISSVFGIIFGIVILYVVLHYLGAFITRLFFTFSIGMLLTTFFTSIGYLIFGASIFNLSYIGIIFGISIAITLAWLVYPEWWVVTFMAVSIAIAGAALFGSSFAPLSIIVLLVILAIYDYVAVIRTKFMVNFAKKVMSVQLPAAITLPYSRDTSLIKQGINFDNVEERTDRGFMILGTGDLLFPTMLAVSVATFGTITKGFIVGLFILISYLAMMYVMYFGDKSSKIQALPGLPFLCTGAIIGYMITLI